MSCHGKSDVQTSLICLVFIFQAHYLDKVVKGMAFLLPFVYTIPPMLTLPSHY